ncbi:cytochrome c3 family protein [Geotalea toluenoxydans]
MGRNLKEDLIDNVATFIYTLPKFLNGDYTVIIMKKSIFLMLMLLSCTVVAEGAYTFKAYNGDITFDHVNHRRNFTCGDCHNGPPRFIELDHDSAHKLCLGCHRKLGVGPLQHCSDCHKRD